MKFEKILEAATKTLAGVRLGGKKSDQNLADLDRGVLTVGLLVAAIDGAILPEEYAAFEALAKTSRGGSPGTAREVLDAALPATGRLMAMSQVGVYSDAERMAAFLEAAEEALPDGFAAGSMADLRRAFALWVMVGVSDGTFSDEEKAALTALEERYAAVQIKEEPKKMFRLLEPDFLDKAEKVARDLATPARRAKAGVALNALIASVTTADGRGNEIVKPSNGIAVRLAIMAVIGFSTAGLA